MISQDYHPHLDYSEMPFQHSTSIPLIGTSQEYRVMQIINLQTKKDQDFEPSEKF